jgi:hypothetical protein
MKIHRFRDVESKRLSRSVFWSRWKSRGLIPPWRHFRRRQANDVLQRSCWKRASNVKFFRKARNRSLKFEASTADSYLMRRNAGFTSFYLWTRVELNWNWTPRLAATVFKLVLEWVSVGHRAACRLRRDRIDAQGIDEEKNQIARKSVKLSIDQVRPIPNADLRLQPGKEGDFVPKIRTGLSSPLSILFCRVERNGFYVLALEMWALFFGGWYAQGGRRAGHCCSGRRTVRACMPCSPKLSRSEA